MNVYILGGLVGDELGDVEETRDWALLVVIVELSAAVYVLTVDGVVSVFDQTSVEDGPTVLVDVASADVS